MLGGTYRVQTAAAGRELVLRVTPLWPVAGVFAVLEVSGMASMSTLNDRIEGCLIGAAIGAELGWYRYRCPERLQSATAEELFRLELDRAPDGEEDRPNTSRPDKMDFKRTWALKSTPFVELGVRAYLNKRGRVTPEDFARELAGDEQVSAPAIIWDPVHTIQELLREGMQPRLSGLGAPPHGLLTAAMPAVGIYHYADPDYAYLDGVELASVAQPRLGADWAGLAAAAVAAAFCRDEDGVVQTVLDLAFENNKELFYQLNHAVQHADSRFAAREDRARLDWWQQSIGRYDAQRRLNFTADNPLFFVLPLLRPFAGETRQLFAMLLWPESPYPMGGSWLTNPVLAGAIVGARYGREAFPAEWLIWAEPIARPWFALEEIVAERTRRESEVLEVCAALAAPARDGLSLLEDKIYGCLLASSIGNAMGSVTEGKHYLRIDEQYPGGLTTIQDPRRLETEDDNQMAMLLAETYLARDGRPVMARHFGRTWRERLNRDRFFPMCMGNAYDLICAGWDPRITGHWSQVTGSTLMCMEPVGIYHVVDPEYAAIDAAAISYMYQRGLDVTAAAILAATVAEALRPDATVESVCQAALAVAPRTELRTFDRRAFASCRDYLECCLAIADKYRDVMAARRALYEKCLLYSFIDPLETLGLALAFFHIAQGDVRLSAIGGTNIGRDADTIAGRAAMLSGTLRGAGNVPREWMDLFQPASLARIRENARRLNGLILDKKLAVLRSRQALGSAAGVGVFAR